MKVFIVTKEPFPNGMAATNRIKCYARAIHEGGIECEIVVCGIVEKKSVNFNNTQSEGLYEGVPYKYIGGSTMGSSVVPIRKFRQLCNQLSAARYIKKNFSRGDILFLYFGGGGSVRLALFFMNIARSKGAYCVKDLCELPYGTVAETSRAIRFRKITIEKQFPRLDGIISISDALSMFAKSYTNNSCKHIKVPILVDFEQYFMEDNSKASDIPYIFHAGTLNEQKDGILGIIEAIGKAFQKLGTPIQFISTGYLHGSLHEEQIQRLIAKYHLEDIIKFVGYISNSELKDYLSKASLVVINKYKTQQNNYCFSTKLGEYLAASKPVIITNVGEAVNWLKDGESAYVIEPENVDVLSDAIIRVFNNPEKSRQIGLAGQDVCRRCFDYKNWSQPLVSFFSSLGK